MINLGSLLLKPEFQSIEEKLRHTLRFLPWVIFIVKLIGFRTTMETYLWYGCESISKKV